MALEKELGIAARNGRLDLVKNLIEQGADLHARDEYALILAGINGHLGLVKYLVEQGADPQVILDNANNYKPEIVNYLYYLAKVRPIIKKINN
jgi:ankyrin repeat protein